MAKKSEAAALLQHYKERRERLRAVGSPWVDAPRKKANGAFNIPTTDESLYWDYVAGVIDLNKAACEFHRCGWDNFIDEKATMERFQELDKKYHKLGCETGFTTIYKSKNK